MIADFDDFCTWMFMIVDDLWHHLAPLYRRPARARQPRLLAHQAVGVPALA